MSKWWLRENRSWVMGLGRRWMEIWTESVTESAFYGCIVHMWLSCLWAEPVLAAMLDKKQGKPRLAETCSKGLASCLFSSHLSTRHPDGHGVAGWPRISVWGNSICSSSKMTEHFSRWGWGPLMLHSSGVWPSSAFTSALVPAECLLELLDVLVR